MRCNGASSREGARAAATAVFVLRIKSKPKVPNSTTPTANNFFISPPEERFFIASLFPEKSTVSQDFSRLWCEDKNSGLFVIMSRCGDVVAIQLRRPKRGAGTGFCGYFPDGFVMIRIFLLVGENIAHIIVAAPGNVHSFLRSIEIDAIHSLNGREICDLLAGLRIHRNHLWRRACPDEQTVRFFIKGSVAIPLAAQRPGGHHRTLACVYNLDSACGGNENEQSLTGLIEQQLRGVRRHFDIAQVPGRLGVDNPDVAVVLAGLLATVSYV